MNVSIATSIATSVETSVATSATTPTIYITGTPNCGLGNILFKISTAIQYTEKFKEYGYKIILDVESQPLYVGTSVSELRNRIRKTSTSTITYDQTIFRKLTYGNIPLSPLIITNNYTSNVPPPSSTTPHIQIDGYCQNIDLFYEYRHKIMDYISVEDTQIVEYIAQKYELYPTDIITPHTINIMVGFRICDDFAHMTKITGQSYQSAFDKIINSNPHNTKYNVVVISDTYDDIENRPAFSFLRPLFSKKNINILFMNEDDVTQMHAGILCDHFILCESTFHYWMAVLKEIQCMRNGTQPPVVYCFTDTDLTNRPLAFPHWNRVTY